MRLCLFAHCSAFLGWRNRHLRMSLSSGRIVVTKFPSTGYKMLFLSFITLTRESERERDRGRRRQKWRRKPGKRTGREGMTSCWLFTTDFMIFSSFFCSTSAGLRKGGSDWTELLVVRLCVSIQSDSSHLFLSKPVIHFHWPHFVGKHNTSCWFRFI